MIVIRPADERGHADHGWLDSRHTFSFADYHDPEHVQWGPLRVINEDRVAPGMGFGAHGHRDMEIVSYVIDGALRHQDNMGNTVEIRPHEVQRMTAGTGVVHSEFNASQQRPVHFLQIWIIPEVRGLRPGYEQKTFAPDDKRGRLRVVASRDGREGSVTLHQDATILASLLPAGASVTHPIAPGRRAWLQVVRGRVELDGRVLSAGDGAAIAEEPAVTLRGAGLAEAADPAAGEAELLLFDLP